MKIRFLFLAFVLNALSAFCQEKFFELRLPEEFRTRLIASTTHSIDKSIFQHYLVATKNKISHIYLSHDGKKREVSTEIANDADSDTDTLDNATLDDTKIIFVWEKILMFIWGRRNDLRYMFMDFQNGHYYLTHYDHQSKKLTTYRYYQFL